MSIITCQFCYFLTPFHSWLLFMICVLKVAKTNGISDIVTSSEMRRAINCKANLFHMVLCEASNELGLIDGTRWQLEYYAMIPSDWSSNMVWHITPTPTLPLFCADSIETGSFSINPIHIPNSIFTVCGLQYPPNKICNFLFLLKDIQSSEFRGFPTESCMSPSVFTLANQQSKIFKYVQRHSNLSKYIQKHF